MTLWLQAAIGGLCQTDRTDKTDETPATQAKLHKESADQGVQSVLSVCQFDAKHDHAKSLCPPKITGQVIPWPSRGYPPEAIRQGASEAFADWWAMNDPHDPRAWA